jgi:hypothetical protein
MSKYLLLALILGACSHSTFYAPKNVYPPTDPNSVVISSQKSLTLPYKTVGRVATLVWGGGDSARESLQKEAAKLGANAVIDFRLEKGSMRTSASGIAVLLIK